MVPQGGEHGIGHAADPELERGALGHQGGYPQPDRLVHLPVITGPERRRRQRLVRLDRQVDLVHWQHSIAVAVRHLRVDLGDDQTATSADGLDHGRQDVHLRAE